MDKKKKQKLIILLIILIVILGIILTDLYLFQTSLEEQGLGRGFSRYWDK